MNVNDGINPSIPLKTLYDNGFILARTYNSLHCNGFETIGDVFDKVKDLTDLMRFKKFGKRSYLDFTEALNVIKKEGCPERKATTSDDSNTINNCIELAYDTITKTNNKYSHRIKEKYNSALKLHLVLTENYQTLLTVEPDFSFEENISLRHLYLLFIIETINNIEKQSLTNHLTYSIYKDLKTKFGDSINDFTAFEKAHYFMSPLFHCYFEDLYQKMFNNILSYEAKRLIRTRSNSFEDALNFIGKPFDAYYNIFQPHYITKTLEEIYNFYQDFNELFNVLCERSEEDLYYLKTIQKYPYIPEGERKFVKQFINEYKHTPLFLLIYDFLCNSRDRKDSIFRLRHGLLDNKKSTLATIASSLHLSRERVRQLSNHPSIMGKNFIFSDELQYYKGLLELPFICEDTNEFLQIKKEEHLPFGFDIFAQIMTIVGDYRIIKIKKTQ